MHLLKKVVLVAFVSSMISACEIPGSYLSKSNAGIDISLDVNFHMLTSENINQFQEKKIKARINPELDNLIDNYNYQVGFGDILNILVWEHPELNMQTRNGNENSNATDSGSWVQQDGTIFYPYVGSVYVKDKTVIQIRKMMSDLLSKYIESPQVDVNVISFRSKHSYITGEVNRPGKQPITNIPLTLLDAINQAGGLAEDADWRNTILTRNGQEIQVSLLALMHYGDLEQNYLLKAGDIVHVPRNDVRKIFVMGEVHDPKLLKMGRMGMSLTEALSLVGGINQLEADATGVFVIRKGAEIANKQQKQIANVYQLNIQDASSLILGTQFDLKPEDILYVTAAPIARWNRVIRQLLPTISGFNELTESFFRIKNY